MPSSEVVAAILAVLTSLTSIGWFKTSRDKRAAEVAFYVEKRSADLAFYQKTIEDQNKVIDVLRLRVTELETKIAAILKEVKCHSPSIRRRPAKKNTDGNQN